jgi:hypothetical protein
MPRKPAFWAALAVVLAVGVACGGVTVLPADGLVAAPEQAPVQPEAAQPQAEQPAAEVAAEAVQPPAEVSLPLRS